ncbi:MAG: hypothetical protein Kow006_20700 [Gammaproteobacteria bacterium]
MKVETITLEPGPVLLFGGPYSNLAATRAMRERAVRIGISPGNCICTGDIVAYCANPEATVNTIREWGVRVVMGNCEESLGEEAKDCGCGFDEGSTCSVLSAGWYDYANRHISRESRAWMRTLPRHLGFELAGRRFRVIHGGDRQINRFLFASSPPEAKREELEGSASDAVVGGHCGIPFGERIGKRAWLNTGAIGLPANDGTRDGWYLILTPRPGGIRAEWHRLVYDAEAEYAAMHSAGLTGGYAEALLSGLWPSMDVLPEVERRQRGVMLAPPPLEF